MSQENTHFKGDFSSLCNKGLVSLEAIESDEDIQRLYRLINDHKNLTNSSNAKKIINNWGRYIPKFVKIMPNDYKKILEQIKEKKTEGIQ